MLYQYEIHKWLLGVEIIFLPWVKEDFNSTEFLNNAHFISEGA